MPKTQNFINTNNSKDKNLKDKTQNEVNEKKILSALTTQYQNPVMSVKLKITRFCNWLYPFDCTSWL
jgi:hypothetical protein